MAWRQKQWKYKNTAPKLPKKEEWITGVSASRLMLTPGNYIQANSLYMAFNIDGHGGGSLGVLPLKSKGSYKANLPILFGHSDFISDFGFSPHDDTLLATISFDNFVKIWQLPAVPVTTTPTTPALTFPELPRRGDALQWNPLVGSLMSICSGHLLRLYDCNAAAKLFDFDCHEEVIQGACWSLDGAAIGTTCKDKKVRVFDPRVNSSAPVQIADGHQGVKDSRIVFVNENRIVTTGYDAGRSRECNVYDSRNMSSSLSNVNLDNNTGTIMPLFDQDTDMLYLVGKGDNNIRFVESASKPPYLNEAACDNLVQVKGACLLPKTCVDVMKGEVNRLMVLTKDCVVPVPYIIPRRSYSEFHADVFPDTYSRDVGCTVNEWLDGASPKVSMVSLNPELKGEKSEAIEVKVEPINSAKPAAVNKPSAESEITSKLVSENTPASVISTNGHSANAHSTNSVTATSERNGVSKRLDTTSTQTTPKSCGMEKSSQHAQETCNQSSGDSNVHTETCTTQTTPGNASSRSSGAYKDAIMQTHRPLKWVHLRARPVAVRTSKFRHLKGTALHRSERIENIRNLSNSMPGESNGFAVNATRCAISLKGTAGYIAVLELDNSGKLDDNPLPTLTNVSGVTDFMWDPFDDLRLAVALENGVIHLWDIPEEGLTETLEQPTVKIPAHQDKIYSILYHPRANNVLASASQDMTVKIWDLDAMQAKVTLEGHTNAIFSMAWCSRGVFLATFSKDGMIRVYDPRSDSKPISEGMGPPGARGGRLFWVLDDTYIAISGFDKQSTRLLQLYDPEDLSVGVATVDLDTSPSILIPHYDADSHTIFLTGRGDSLVQAYEVSADPPFLHPLSSFHANGQHQALGFVNKTCVDVRKVEFAKAYRLTNTMIEPISFTVPRVKMEYFQDDLFPPTYDVIATVSSEEYFQGTDKNPPKVDLKPSDMTKLSDAPPEEVKERKYEKFDPTNYKTDEQKRDELVNAVTAKLNVHSEPLPQDLTEGVDSDEWDDED